MDRRTAIGLGLAAAFSRSAWADTVVPGDGVLPSDPKEVVALWSGTPPGGQGLRLPPIRVSNHEPPYLTPADRAIDQVGNPIMNVLRSRQARWVRHDPGAGRRLFPGDAGFRRHGCGAAL